MVKETVHGIGMVQLNWLKTNQYNTIKEWGFSTLFQAFHLGIGNVTVWNMGDFLPVIVARLVWIVIADSHVFLEASKMHDFSNSFPNTVLVIKCLQCPLVAKAGNIAAITLFSRFSTYLWWSGQEHRNLNISEILRNS